MDKGKRKIVLVVHNVRSAHNVGSLLRSADGFGVERVYLSGYTPYPSSPSDTRLPHLHRKISQRIQKTALGAEQNLNWQHVRNPAKILSALSAEGFTILALEQTSKAKDLSQFKASKDVVLIVGSEIGGIEPALLKLADKYLQIPMLGQKDSFNVSVAAAAALYHLRYMA